MHAVEAQTRKNTVRGLIERLPELVCSSGEWDRVIRFLVWKRKIRRQAAEDAIQEALTRGLESRANERPQHFYWNLLVGNKARSRARAEHRENDRSIALGVVEDPVVYNTVCEEISQNRALEIMFLELDGVDDEAMQALIIEWLAGESLAPTAAALEIPETTARRQVKDFQERVKQQLRKADLGKADLLGSITLLLGADKASHVVGRLLEHSGIGPAAGAGALAIAVMTILFMPPRTVPCEEGQRGCSSSSELCWSGTPRPKTPMTCSCFNASGVGRWGAMSGDTPAYACPPGETLTRADNGCRPGGSCGFEAEVCATKSNNLLTCSEHGRWEQPNTECSEGASCKNDARCVQVINQASGSVEPLYCAGGKYEQTAGGLYLKANTVGTGAPTPDG